MAETADHPNNAGADHEHDHGHDDSGPDVLPLDPPNLVHDGIKRCFRNLGDIRLAEMPSGRLEPPPVMHGNTSDP